VPVQQAASDTSRRTRQVETIRATPSPTMTIWLTALGTTAIAVIRSGVRQLKMLAVG
jgi:hypothetical protein